MMARAPGSGPTRTARWLRGARGRSALAAVRVALGEASTAELTDAGTRDSVRRSRSPEASRTRARPLSPEGVLPSRARRQDRPRPAARQLDRQPGPLEPDRALAPRRHRLGPGRGGPGRACPPLAEGLRAGDTGTTSSGGPAGPSRATTDALARRWSDRSRPRRRRDRLRPRRRPRADPQGPNPWGAVLPALDATTMGWADPRLVPGPAPLRSCSIDGEGGPTIWVDGPEIVGGWVQRDGRRGRPRPPRGVGPQRRARRSIARWRAWPIGSARSISARASPPRSRST